MKLYTFTSPATSSDAGYVDVVVAASSLLEASTIAKAETGILKKNLKLTGVKDLVTPGVLYSNQEKPAIQSV